MMMSGPYTLKNGEYSGSYTSQMITYRIGHLVFLRIVDSYPLEGFWKNVGDHLVPCRHHSQHFFVEAKLLLLEY